MATPLRVVPHESRLRPAPWWSRVLYWALIPNACWPSDAAIGESAEFLPRRGGAGWTTAAARRAARAKPLWPRLFHWFSDPPARWRAPDADRARRESQSGPTYWRGRPVEPRQPR